MDTERRVKDHIKSQIVEFWMQHKDFDNTNPTHIREVKNLLVDLRHNFPLNLITEVVEEFRGESEELVKEARENFIRKIKEANEGKYETATAIECGITGELEGSSDERGSVEKEKEGGKI